MTEMSKFPFPDAAGASRTQTFLLGSLYLFAFCLPWSKSAVTVLIPVIALTIAVHLLVRKELAVYARRALAQPLSVPLVLLFGIAAIGILHSQRLTDGLAIANKVLALPLVYLLFSTVLEIAVVPSEREEFVQRLLMSFLAGVLVLDMIGFLTYFGFVGHERHVLPLAPMNMHHIWFSNVNALAIYAAVAELLYDRTQVREQKDIALILFIAAALAAVVFSLSRTAWFGVLVTGMVMAFLFMPRKKMFFVVLAAVIIACVLAYRTSPLVQDRLNTAVNDMAVYTSGKTDTSTSLGDRFFMWKGAVRMFLSNPLFGVGTGDYNAEVASFVQRGELPRLLLQYNQPHNMYLFTLATNGLAGLGALLYVFWRVFRTVLPISARTGTARLFGFLALAATVHFMFAGMFDSLFNIFVLRYSFAFIIALTVRNYAEIPRQEGHQS
jgi:O-antigen ligase